MDYFIILWMLLECLDIGSTDCSTTNCSCDGSELKCFYDIPENIPSSITEVSIYEANLGERISFGDGWDNVKRLSINPGMSSSHYKPNNAKTLHSYEFIKLKNLETLQIACRCLTRIQYNAFKGLDKLKVLDLSNNYYLHINYVTYGLSGVGILPNISELYLSGSSGADIHPVNIGRKFYNVVKQKHLTVLDVSNINTLWFDYTTEDILTAFPFLEKINISGAGIVIGSIAKPFLFLNIYPTVTSFKRLKSLDLSYVDIPFQITENVYTSRYGQNINYQLPHGLTSLYGKRLITTPGKLNAWSNSTHVCLWLGSISACYIGNFDNLKTLVLSENFVEYVDPQVFRSVPSLQYLDIARNRFGDASSDGFVKSILDILQKLEFLSMSDNGIYDLPENTFSQCKTLRVLDLSLNQLATVAFKTDGMTSLTKLDLSENKITFLDANSLQRLDNLLSHQGSVLESRKVEINLEDNPFLCSCEATHFLKWLTTLNESLVCTIDSEESYIDIRLIQRVEYLCKEKLIIAVFTLFSITVILIAAATMYFLVLERKKARLAKLKEKGIACFAAKQLKSHPVFLSFCSTDDETVMQEIFPHLENGLKKILNTNASCVATGYNAFRPGFSIANEIIRCVEASSVVVFVITNAFCRKMWCRNETLVAHYENKPIVLMLWENVDEKFMPKYLFKHYIEHVRVHWVQENGQKVMKPGWDEVCESIVCLFAQKKNKSAAGIA